MRPQFATPAKAAAATDTTQSTSREYAYPLQRTTFYTVAIQGGATPTRRNASNFSDSRAPAKPHITRARTPVTEALARCNFCQLQTLPTIPSPSCIQAFPCHHEDSDGPDEPLAHVHEHLVTPSVYTREHLGSGSGSSSSRGGLQVLLHPVTMLYSQLATDAYLLGTTSCHRHLPAKTAVGSIIANHYLLLKSQHRLQERLSQSNLKHDASTVSSTSCLGN